VKGFGAVLAVAGCLVAVGVRADIPLPPWVGEGDVPLASWARSVAPKPGEGHRGALLASERGGDMVLFAGSNRASGRRGVTAPGATLPIFGARHGSGCIGSWWLVGPLAWTCSDDAALLPDEPNAANAVELTPRSDGLPREYFFVARAGASAYADIDSADEGTPDRELEGGWGVAVVEERTSGGERWARTSKGLWIALRDLGAARPSMFRGEHLPGGDGPLDLAWVVTERAAVWAEPPAGSKSKAKDAKARFEVVHVLEESGSYDRVGDAEWMLARDLARPHRSAPPAEVTRPGERWIDVELASQTLVAYEGTHPVYATLVSTGRGAPGTEAATPPGVHRIWVKIRASDMDNVERDGIEAHYSLEDVPYVQFFDHAVALHGTYWHRDFGHVKSHGCVNLAPLDARWLFDFTGPRLPAGWVAAYPVPQGIDPGTAVRVR
jgi:lipoprotein-anchoring transpeptidase ErfK/SrfK